MTKSLALKRLSELVRSWGLVRTLSLNEGEVLLHPHIAEVLDTAASLGLQIRSGYAMDTGRYRPIESWNRAATSTAVAGGSARKRTRRLMLSIDAERGRWSGVAGTSGSGRYAIASMARGEDEKRRRR